jgi:lipopolysaccharide cholinephosphotransferase
MNNDQLRKLQLVQLEILKVIDRVCRKHKIQYSLHAGTLLGAIRHKGFIPWDDDLDICMLRDDYNRFIHIWNEPGYILQNKENTPNFTQSFSKIRKDRTAYIHTFDEQGKYHTGIFVDVFPVDRIPNTRVQRYIFWWRCMRYQLYTREFIPPKSGLLVRAVSKIYLSLIRGKRRVRNRNILFKKITKYNVNSKLNLSMIDTINTMCQIYPHNLFDNIVEIDFENNKFMAFMEWDEVLTIRYSDYMQLPPEEERSCKHNPIFLSFEKNSEEINIEGE